MNNINSVIETLNNNQFLNNQAKEAIMHIVGDMYRKGYLNDFNELNNKLTNLQIVEGNLTDKVIDYQNGKIIIDPSQVNYYDHNLALASVIIDLLRKYPDKGQITEPISLGFNESYAISLVGLDGRALYEEEQVFSRMLGKMIDENVLANIYFNGNMAVDLPQALLRLGCTEQDITRLLKMIQENFNSKK